MKFYAQEFDIRVQKIVFDVLWGEKLPEDESFAVCKNGNVWMILDIESGLSLLFKKGSKKALLELYQEKIKQKEFRDGIKTTRESFLYSHKVSNMQNHKIFHAGDRVTYIDVKDSVILDLIEYDPKSDMWIVTDEWHKFSVSPDRVIKLSEVI